MVKNICLTFDVEEFDLPKEYGISISEDEMNNVSLEGLKNILNLVNSFDVKCTFFVTTVFALKNKKLIKEMALKHEIGYHGYLHSDDYRVSFGNLEKGKKELEKIIGKNVVGFRAPRMFGPKRDLLKNLGFVYDSSYVPTYMPGRYNNFFGKREIFNDSIFVIPVTVLPLLRIPFIWFIFRNFGLWFAKLCTYSNSYVNQYFHPWEFVDLKDYNVPFFVKRKTGDKCLNLLRKYIQWCKKKKYSFITLNELVKNL